MIRFFNTLSGKKESFRTLVPGKVKLYTCGPTVYDFAHIGNFRAYIFEDLLKRFLIFMGFKVQHVMNITDVDDKTIRSAKARGISLQEYTKTFIDSFFEDIQALNILKADHYPRATEFIPQMTKMIEGLLQKGYAYKKNGSVYFEISKFPDYGKLSGINLEELKSGGRVDADEYEKESVHDFALWKEKKEGEFYWDSDIGPGRPGWHIECSVMSSSYFGPSLDIHCGGVDNIFPHHENERAQSEAFFGQKFVNIWMHCHHLIVEGEKMSKSKGNQYTIQDIRSKECDPLALRLLLLSTHYRKTLNFSFKTLEQSVKSLSRIRNFLDELKNPSIESGHNASIERMIEESQRKFIEGLSDDLNISVSIKALFDLIKKVNVLMIENQVFKDDAEKLMRHIRNLDQVLGLLPDERAQEISSEILEKIKERERARANKNYALADKIRNELLEQGIHLEDTKDGVRWKIWK